MKIEHSSCHSLIFVYRFCPTHSKQKTMFRILPLLSFIIFMTFTGFSQIADNTEIPDTFAFVCNKHPHIEIITAKTVINPNPFVDDYDVKFIKLNLEAYDTTDQFSGYAEIAAEVGVSEMDTFSVELHDKLAADSVFINGTNTPFSHTNNNLYVPVDPVFNAGQMITFRLYYHTPETYSSTYYTVSESPTYGNFKSAHSFSEPYYAHEWMPCKQELTDKADSVHIFITTDTNLRVAGPGVLTEVLLPNGKIRYEWRTYEKTAYYLIAFAVSDYQQYSIYAKPDSLPGDSIHILNYVFDYPNCLESNINSINNTKNFIELLSNMYGLFPFHEEKYGHYMWYPTNFSGMEHITMSGVRSFSYDLVSHELAHSWFGDEITCATWQDIWINEGFATYTQYIVRENLISKANADAQMLAYHNYVMLSPTGSVYVPASSLSSWGRIFSTRYTYRKGGALLHMIRFEMQSDSLFYKTLWEYRQQFKDSVASGMDFKNVCEQVSGLDFDDFFNQWYFGEGYPVFDLDWWQDEDTLFLQVHQGTSTPITPLYKLHMEYGIQMGSNDTTVLAFQQTNDTLYKIIIPEEVTDVIIDPNNWVLNQTGTIRHLKSLRFNAFLEGPFNNLSSEMSTLLNPELLPLQQPYNQPPWNYNGTEMAVLIPTDAVDWVLIRLFDTTDVSLASPPALMSSKAGFILKDGTITDSDGKTPIRFTETVNHDLFVSIHHRNHLSVVAATALNYDKGNYQFDFTIAGANYANTPQKEIQPGVWSMIAGDANADGQVDDLDKTVSWENNAGKNSYDPADLNLDGQVDNKDKDDYWYPNLGLGK